MSYYKGVVSRVHIGQPVEPKNPDWGKSAKFGLEIDGKWHNGFCSEDKRTGAFAVKDKNYKVITEGTEVEFMTTEKNGFENIDKKTMQVISGAPQQPQPQQVAQQPTVVEKVPQIASNDPLMADIKWIKAALIALITFKDKHFPEGDMLEQVERKAKTL
jgi:hypothetical protein